MDKTTYVLLNTIKDIIDSLNNIEQYVTNNVAFYGEIKTRNAIKMPKS